jgi:hypothetical protein
MKVSSVKKEDKIQKKGPVGIIKYIIALIILAIVIIVLVLSIVQYQNRLEKVNKLQNKYEVYNNFFVLSRDFRDAVKNFYDANNNYVTNKISDESYAEMVFKKPQTIEALNNCEQALNQIYTIYNKIMKYESDASLSSIISSDKVECYKPIMETCHNICYGSICNYNTTIDTYNVWASEKINNQLYASFVKENNINIISKYTSNICSGWLDLNADGNYQGKAE